MALGGLGQFLDSLPGLAVMVAALAAVLAALRFPLARWQQGRYTGRVLVVVALMFVALVFLLLSVWFPARGEVSAAAVPRLWVFGLMACCLYLLVRTFRGGEAADPRSDHLSLVLLYMGLSVGYLVLIQLLGFFLSSFLFLVAAMSVLGYRKRLVLLAVAVGWVAFAYLVFYRMLFVPLPEGLLVRLLTR